MSASHFPGVRVVPQQAESMPLLEPFGEGVLRARQGHSAKPTASDGIRELWGEIPNRTRANAGELRRPRLARTASHFAFQGPTARMLRRSASRTGDILSLFFGDELGASNKLGRGSQLCKCNGGTNHQLKTNNGISYLQAGAG